VWCGHFIEKGRKLDEVRNNATENANSTGNDRTIELESQLKVNVQLQLYFVLYMQYLIIIMINFKGSMVPGGPSVRLYKLQYMIT